MGHDLLLCPALRRRGSLIKKRRNTPCAEMDNNSYWKLNIIIIWRLPHKKTLRALPAQCLSMRYRSGQDCAAQGSAKVNAFVQRHEPRAQVEIADPRKAGFFEHAGQGGLVRMHAYGFGQITVAVLVASDFPAQPGQYIEGIPVVGGRK